MKDKLKVIETKIYNIIVHVFHINISCDKWTRIIQFAKFGLVGVLNNAISYITYLLLIGVEMHYILANIIGFSISVLNSYYWNNKYVFGLSEKNRVWWKTLLKTYISYAGTGIVFSNVLLVLWINIFSISKIIAPLLNLIVTVPINFVVNKYWAYK